MQPLVTLVKIATNDWQVALSGTLEFFKSIEDASSYLEDVGIKDAEIDTALIHMAAFNHDKSHFDLKTGSFLSSEEL